MITISSDTGKLLALSMLKGVGPASLRMALNVANFSEKPIDAIAAEVPRLSAALQPSSWTQALERAEIQVEHAEKAGACIISVLDASYPALLKATKDDPVILFVKGRFHENPARSAAVIGTRAPTKHGVLIAERISQFFAEHGWSVVSGLALGLDAIAHSATMKAGGHTTAVLAHGLHTVAPTKHKSLAQEIIEKGGALVSEYGFGVDPRPEFFVKRDRIQAGLAQGVVMIQSDLKGGSLHASRASLDYGRWLAVPEPTKADSTNMEPKIQANSLIASNDTLLITELLRCSKSSIKDIIVLKSRDDYQRLLLFNNSSSIGDAAPPQKNLL